MREARRAVVLARGLGSRMRAEDGAALDPAQAEAAAAGLKAMIPIGRPFLDYVLSALADAGLEQVCLVIGPEHDSVRRYYSHERPPRRLQITFAVQEKPLGTADALLAAEEFAGREGFLVLNSDNYYPADCLRQLRRMSEPAAALFSREDLLRESPIAAGRLRGYALCTVGEDGYLTGILEKPDESVLEKAGPGALVSMNLWRFDGAIFGPCRETPLSPRGEKELPRAVNEAVSGGKLRVRVILGRGAVLDLSRRGDVAEVARRLAGVEAAP